MEFNREIQFGQAFLQLPWHTDVFRSTDLAQRFCGCPEAEEYVRKILERETEYKLHPAVEYAQQFLRGELTEKSNQVHLAAGLGCLLNYKLVDVLLWRHIQENTASCSEEPYSIDNAHIWPGDKIQDWKAVVAKAYSASLVLSNQDFHQRAKDLADTDALKKLMRNTRKGGAFLKILGNIVGAADYLQHLLRGNLDISIDELNKTQLNTSEKEVATESQQTPAQIRAALYAALVIGPVYLLKPAHVEGSPLSRMTLIDTWRVLGTNQPPSLMKCNLILWDLIIDGATGRQSLYAGLCDALRKCSDVLKEVNDVDARWYSRDHKRFNRDRQGEKVTKDVAHLETLSTNVGESMEEIISYQTRKAYNLTQNRPATAFEDAEQQLMDVDTDTVSSHVPTTSDRVVNEQHLEDAHNQASNLSRDSSTVIRQQDGGTGDRETGKAISTPTEDVQMAENINPELRSDDEESERSQDRQMDVDEPSSYCVSVTGRKEAGGKENIKDGGDSMEAANDKCGYQTQGDAQSVDTQTEEEEKQLPTHRSLRSSTLEARQQSAQATNAANTQKQSSGANRGKRKRSNGKQTQASNNVTSSTVVESDSDTSDNDIVYMGTNIVSCKVDLGPLYQSKIRIKKEENDKSLSFDRENEVSDAPSTVKRVYAERDIEYFDLRTKERDTHRPYLHYDKELKLLYDVNDEARKTYHEGLPAYFTPGAPSSIHLMSYDEFTKSTTAQLSTIFETKHIAVYGKPDQGYDFTRQDIEKVFGISANVTRTIQDQTVICDESYTEWNRQGCLLDILHSAELGEQGKSLNGLDNKLSFDWDFHSVLELDRAAWQEAVDLAFCPISDRFPVNDMRWGLVGNAGCYSLIHIDSNGFATVVEVLSGLKEWFVAVPKNGKGVDEFATVHTFTRGYQTDKTNKSRFNWEKICLDPTTIFIQRPCTPHIVFTPKHSFVRGRFFYSTASLHSSIYGIFHDLSNGENVTNTEHNKASIALLTRILAFYHLHFIGGREIVQTAHLPNFLDFSSVLKVSALCAHFEIANALYNFNDDPEDLQIKTRHLFIRNRKRGRELIDFIHFRYVFKRSSDDDERQFKEKIYYPYVAKLAYLSYLYRVKSDAISKRNPVTAPDVLLGLRRCFQHPTMQEVSVEFERMMEMGLKEEQQTFAWTGPSYLVEKNDQEGKYMYQPADGLNGDDLEFGLEPREVSFEDFPDLIAKDKRGTKRDNANVDSKEGSRKRMRKLPRKV